MRDKVSTREASSIQEKRIAKKLDGTANPNSGAGMTKKGDVELSDIGLLVECKTCMTPKQSFSIKKDWIEKNKQEAFMTRNNDSVIAFNFDYTDKKDYYIINDKLMTFLVEKLREENEQC